MPPTALHPHHNSDLLHRFPPSSRPPPPLAFSPEQGLLLHEHPYPSTKLGCLLVPSSEQRTFLYGPSPKKLHLLYILPQVQRHLLAHREHLASEISIFANFVPFFF
ncbi:hypothetical protein VPH35_065785 [Triticum aestivum]